ncbi:hypothetical protein ACJIZ3_018373 [Penstemon smallii]|uniref:Uncharacterized protein n=1 Tax=Penstemon smallii TaxID=265156 RepID=A0ABD3SZ24_9LAMI
MSNFFGGKDPFDHPFFSHPFGGKSPFFTRLFDDNRPDASRKQITIEELNPNGDDDSSNVVWQKNKPNKELSFKDSNEFPTGVQSVSYQRVSYGGVDGMYYTSSVGRRTGGDGVVLMEMKEEDKTVGESLHTISKGIHDKGHSFTTKRSSDGRIDSLQTLHNLNEDELDGFEENWKITADKVLPGWSNGFNLLENSGVTIKNPWDDDFASWGGWPLPTLEYFGNDRVEPEPSGESNGLSSRKVVPLE